MSHLKLLDGTVDEVKNGLTGLDRATLTALLDGENGGKKRAGVTSAINAAIADLPGDSGEDNGIEAATDILPSGAPNQVVPDVDLTHPAVDADPRANTTAEQNRIDFNDPAKSGVEVVSEQLGMTKPDEA